MSNLIENIHNTIEALSKQQNISHRLAEIESEMQLLNNKLNNAEKNMKNELKDVEALQKLSMKGLFYKVLGSKEEQLEKERQEHLQASLVYNSLIEELDLMKFERGVLDDKVMDIDLIKKKLEKLKAERENEIIRTNPKLSKVLLDYSERIDDKVLLKRELLEAKEVGEQANIRLGKVIAELKNAEQWGNWERMSGNSSRSNMMKYGAIDRAKQLSFQAKHYLAQFRKELLDFADSAPDYQFNLDAFDGYMNRFFNNLISDWVVQGRIHKTIKAVLEVKNTVIHNLNQIDKQLIRTDTELVVLNEQRDEVLLRGE